MHLEYALELFTMGNAILLKKIVVSVTAHKNMIKALRFPQFLSFNTTLGFFLVHIIF